MGGSYHVDNLETDIVDTDPMDMSESMQEAMHCSNLDMRWLEAVLNIDLQIDFACWQWCSLSGRKSLCMSCQPCPFSSLIGLWLHLQICNMYYMKRSEQHITKPSYKIRVHPLTFIHHTSTYQASMCKLMEYCLSLAINTLKDRLSENEIRYFHNPSGFCLGPSTKMMMGKLGLQSLVQKSEQDADYVPMPIVQIDQDSDSDATIVQVRFGDRLGALIDTDQRLTADEALYHPYFQRSRFGLWVKTHIFQLSLTMISGRWGIGRTVIGRRVEARGEDFRESRE